MISEDKEKEIWERLAKGESSIKSAHHRLDAIEKIADSVSELAISTNQLAVETKALREDMAQTNEKITNLEEQPKKRYDLIVSAIITAITSGLAGYFVSELLK